MTWRELMQLIPEDQMDTDVVVYVSTWGEYYEVGPHVKIAERTEPIVDSDVLYKGHPFIVIE